MKVILDLFSSYHHDIVRRTREHFACETKPGFCYTNQLSTLFERHASSEKSITGTNEVGETPYRRQLSLKPLSYLRIQEITWF